MGGVEVQQWLTHSFPGLVVLGNGVPEYVQTSSYLQGGRGLIPSLPDQAGKPETQVYVLFCGLPCCQTPCNAKVAPKLASSPSPRAS